MNQLHLERVPHPRNRGFAFVLAEVAAGIVVVVTGAVILAGVVNAPGRTGVGGPGATATPATTSPTATSLATTSSTAQLSCRQTSDGTTSLIAGVRQVRDATLNCTGSATDARLAGENQITFQGDYATDGSATVWGDASLRNASGTWAGTWRGTVDAATGTNRVEGVFFGSGAYQGLRARYTNTGDGERFTQQAVIEPADTVPPAASTVIYGNTCAATNGGVSNSKGDTTGLVLVCNGTPSDPRLEGKFTVTLDMVMRPDGGADMTGTVQIAGSPHSWSGPFTGRIDAGYTTHHGHATLTGTGVDQGLVYTFDLVGLSEGLYVSTGTITPAGG